MLMACAGETYEVNYDTLHIAQASGAIQRGWLPAWLPREAKNIYEVHNLDSNAAMWAAEVPVGAEVSLPSNCSAVASSQLPDAPFKRRWWPEGVPQRRGVSEPFHYFRCGDQNVALAAAGGRLVGWSSQ